MQGKERQAEVWRTLEELEGREDALEKLHREFPPLASEWPDGPSRRNFLKLMGASVALAGGAAGTSGCSDETGQVEAIVPYVVPPEQALPGRPLYYATAMPWCGYGKGVLVESHNGRPTKIEGNPDHPASLGASDVWMQASILDLWDPNRAQTVRQAWQISTWGTFLQALNTELAAKQKNGGAGLRILTGAITSRTMLDQLQRLLQRFPQARWHHYEPVGSDNIRFGSKMAFGRYVQTIYHFDKARVICSLDSDFLYEDPGSLRYARHYTDGRRVRSPIDKEGKQTNIGRLEMNRLYVAESTPSITGAMADHRVRMPASRIYDLVRELGRQMNIDVGGGMMQRLPDAQAGWIASLINDLRANNGASVVVAGPHQPPIIHAFAHSLNQMLGNVGRTVTYHEPVEGHDIEPGESLRQLVGDMNGGSVDVLVILGGNPIYATPADLGFAEAMKKVRLRIQQSLYYDETSTYCHWHIPESHYLETWSDIRAFDGTTSIIQPLIAPLYQSKSAHQLLAALLGETDLAPLAMVKEFWRRRIGGENFERVWHESLRKGVIPNSASPVAQVNANPKGPGGSPSTQRLVEAGGFELMFRPDPHVWDGRFAQNGWLQELPKPLTKLTWDNVALISTGTRDRLNLKNGDIVRITSNGKEIEAPVWILPGHPDDSITIQLGYGRKIENEERGFDAYTLRQSGSPWIITGVQVTKTNRKYALACTQDHQLIDADSTKQLIRSSSLEQFKKDVEAGHKAHGGESGHRRLHLSIYPDWDYTRGHQWGMVIDNNTCIGCNACVIACQAENNIPIVGKEEVLRNREMHWLRIDTYYHGGAGENPDTYFEPIPCMHCETAPCEVVCPVAATTHSGDGLNEMTYNRCIGTRYCSNNCPYKVRRFNFFQYTKPEDPNYMLRSNPEVTVRERGVMEKCTYCVQRISRTRIELKKLDVPLAEAQSDEKSAARQLMDREMEKLQTACQQACPTAAIIFGDYNWIYKRQSGDVPALVNQLQKQPHDYSLLDELNTKPRTRYLSRFYNRGGNA